MIPGYASQNSCLRYETGSLLPYGLMGAPLILRLWNLYYCSTSPAGASIFLVKSRNFTIDMVILSYEHLLNRSYSSPSRGSIIAPHLLHTGTLWPSTSTIRSSFEKTIVSKFPLLSKIFWIVPLAPQAGQSNRFTPSQVSRLSQIEQSSQISVIFLLFH